MTRAVDLLVGRTVMVGHLLKWTLGLDAFPSYKDPVIPEGQIICSRAAQISY